MASNKKTDQEAHVRGTPPPELDADRDEHGLAVLEVSQGDMPEPDPLHAGPEKLGADRNVFDPNAALRNKMGVGPGLQDSEAKNPAVWVDMDAEASRNAAADAHVQDAERAVKAARKRAEAVRKGEPLDREVR
jgi:hypothetical protein